MKLQITGLGKEIRNLRFKKDWTQERLGFLSDISRSKIQRVEHGASLSLTDLYYLQHALGFECRVNQKVSLFDKLFRR